MTDTQTTTRFEIVNPFDERVIPVLEDLVREYHDRYGDLGGHDSREEVYGGAKDQFTAAARGAFLVLFDANTPLAAGAVRAYDGASCEFKKIWSNPAHRGERLATRLLAQLEEEARRLGYRQVFLTTGPRQSEADRLYARNGYTAHFDPDAFTVHPYTKALVEGEDASQLPARAVRDLVDFGELIARKP